MPRLTRNQLAITAHNASEPVLYAPVFRDLNANGLWRHLGSDLPAVRPAHRSGSFNEINQTIGAEFVHHIGPMYLNGSSRTAEQAGYFLVTLAV